jgi:hypothetical protein
MEENDSLCFLTSRLLLFLFLPSRSLFPRFRLGLVTSWLGGFFLTGWFGGLRLLTSRFGGFFLTSRFSGFFLTCRFGALLLLTSGLLGVFASGLLGFSAGGLLFLASRFTTRFWLAAMKSLHRIMALPVN